MSDSKVIVSNGGIGLGGLLTIIFVILKATGHISWPWLWVFSPLWIPFAIAIAITVLSFVIFCMIFVIAMFIEKVKHDDTY